MPVNPSVPGNQNGSARQSSCVSRSLSGGRPVSGRVVAAALAAALLVGAVERRAAHAQTPPAKTVQLIIDYGDGVQKHFTTIRWRSEMTVLDAMNDARRHPRGIQFRFKGSGATSLLTQIDDRRNEGRGRNWTYRVNGELADRSFAIYRLQAADKVLWRFGEYK